MRKPEIVLLGGPNSGKTHLAAQLYGRILRSNGRLRRQEQQAIPHDLTLLDEALGCLEEGRSASHTGSDTWGEITLPTIDEHGGQVLLKWPDYAGEKVEQMLRLRSISEAWQNRIAQAEGWAIVIRLSHERRVDARPAQPRTSPSTSGSVPLMSDEYWDANARWVEFVQILMHVAGMSSTSLQRKPRVAILLSCYDELPESEESPSAKLGSWLPMFYSFMENNWSPEAWSVWGMSALGQKLDSAHPDESFLRDGPELHGWVIAPQGGPRDSDLTAPIAWLLDRP